MNFHKESLHRGIFVMNLHLSSRAISLIVIVSLGLFLLLLSSCQKQDYPVDHEQLSKEERVVIRFSHIVGENTPKGLAARRFARLVKERTDGLVEVQVFPNGNLYKDGEEMDALLKGDIQMIAPAMSKVTMLVPQWQVLDLPFAFNNIEEVHDYLNSHIGDGLITQLEEHGLHHLGIWDNGFKQFTNNVLPITKPEDLAGLRFRIMPSKVIHDQFMTLKAYTHTSSFNEVYHLLEDGEINGQENTYSNIVSKNLHLMQPHLTISNHGYLGYIILLNKDFWEELPKDIQMIIQDTFEEVTKWEMKKAKEINSSSLQDIKNCQCVEINTLTDQEKQLWEDAFYPVYQRFANRYGAEYIMELPKFNEVNTSNKK